MKALVVIGTRPEAIKLAPVVAALRQNPRIDVEICATGQHRELLAQALDHFALSADYDLAVMTANQTLASLTAKTLEGMARIVKASQPQVTIVQGDTTSAMAAALAAFYARVPVAHVEAGLRTDDKYSPFPEEINRRLVASIADLHFAPTAGAKANLLREGIREDTIVVTGNTAIDALLWTVSQLGDTNIALERLKGGALHIRELSGSRVVLVTAHRRENYDRGIKEICGAILEVAELPDAQIVFPVHFNPNIRSIVIEQLGDRANVHLLAPLDYRSFARILCASFLVLTDSGGVQEEAPSLGKPVLVMRDTTERPEGVAAGNAMLVGTSAAAISGTARELWFDDARWERMARVANPYGDGNAARRICDVIEQHFLP